jgi:K+-transporting ATPase ATPase C chain
MLAHLRANLWLLVVTLLLCSVLYPLALWAAGRAAFREQANGSLIAGPDGKPVGSRLIAQPFSGDEYFQPRPSAASYKADASGASNFAASNPALRDRVARTLGPIVRYRGASPTGKTVQEDIEAWFTSRPDIVFVWAEEHPTSAQAWVNADDKHKDAVTKWSESHPEVIAAWKKANPDSGELKPADLAADYFKSKAAAFHASWPKLIDDSAWTVPAVFFDMWLQAHPKAALEQVPADMVMASASGLDPHITVKNARYQLPRVAEAWKTKTNRDETTVRKAIEDLIAEKQSAPMGGLVGGPLVNVLELNLALTDRMNHLDKSRK